MPYRDHANKDLVSELDGLLLHGAIVRWARYIISSTPTGSEQDTGVLIPAKSVVLPYPIVEVTTAEATGGTKTLDVGISTIDGDGLLAGASVAATGLVIGSLASAGQTLGALLREDESGAGVLVPKPYVLAAKKAVIFKAGSNDWAEFRGRIYVPYIEIVTD